jgi:hypothetical protein
MSTYPDGTSKAVNGIGWEVQWLSPHGWIAVGALCETKQHAKSLCEAHKAVWSDNEYRVYEALK